MPIYHFEISVLLLFTLASSAWGDEPTAVEAPVYSQLDRMQSLQRDVSFRQPVEVNPGKSCTKLALVVKESINLMNGIELKHRSYNGGLVGPTIRVNPGDHLRVHLRNLLPPYPEKSPPESHPNRPHGFNTTNLHTHGLHVSPRSPADDVFKRIKPGESFNYVFEIPKNHHPGTFWYHAHKHGSTALQLASGMSGALIINGGLDNAPVIRDAEEKIMVLQQFTISKQDDGPAIVDPELVYSGDGDLTETINGIATPTVVLRPGEVQRWRIIHAGTTEAIELDIEGVNFYEVAVDGLATGNIIQRNRLRLYPGYRIDVLVKAPMTPDERLMKSAIRDPSISIRESASEERNILKVVVQGTPKPMRLPTADELRQYAAFTQEDVPKEITKTRKITFSTSPDGTRFLVDGKEFDPNVISQQMVLDSSEEWEIVSTGGVHPFHIHVNPFAARIKGSDAPWVWRDTIAVSRRNPIVLRTTYKKFTGKTVLHCHNLRHEDLGMMQAIEIVDPKRSVKSQSIKAPRWSASKINGEVVSSEDLNRGPVLVVLHRGMSCIHCAQQLFVLDEHFHSFEKAGISVVAISPHVPGDTETVEELSKFRFEVLIDKSLDCFKAFKCLFQREVMHGLFLVEDNNIVYSRRTDVAVTDSRQLVDTIIKSLYTEGS